MYIYIQIYIYIGPRFDWTTARGSWFCGDGIGWSVGRNFQPRGIDSKLNLQGLWWWRICVRTCMYTYIYRYLYIYVYIMYTYILFYAYVGVCIMCVCVRARVCACMRVRACMHACVRVCVFCIHTHTCMYVWYIHMYMYTYTPMHMYRGRSFEIKGLSDAVRWWRMGEGRREGGRGNPHFHCLTVYDTDTTYLLYVLYHTHRVVIILALGQHYLL